MKPSTFSDTGRQRAIEDAAERGARRGVESTPPVERHHADSSEMYEISEKVVDRKRPEHILYCENDPAGPVCKVTKRLEIMEKSIAEHGTFINQYLGEQRFKRFVMPVLIGFIGSAAGVALMSLVLKGMLRGVLHP